MTNANVSSRTVKRFFAIRIVDDESLENGRVQRHGFANEPTAWRWVARAALFRARDKRCRCAQIAHDYSGSPAWDGGPGQCRYCDPDQWRPIVARLARILMSRAKQ